MDTEIATTYNCESGDVLVLLENKRIPIYDSWPRMMIYIGKNSEISTVSFLIKDLIPGNYRRRLTCISNDSTFNTGLYKKLKNHNKKLVELLYGN